ncbi:MAG: arginyltransferase [Acidiferrobacterales bacterium]
MTIRLKEPALFTSIPHPCSYLPGRVATTLFIDPQQRLNGPVFAHFARHGFRRSGDFVYRPCCQDCSACVPVRIPVDAFTASRSQRRTCNKNRDLTVRRSTAAFKAEHFELYLRYQRSRHAGGGMDERDPDKYLKFLVTRHVQTQFYELRLGERLVAVTVADVLPDALSAVYTFFDPQESRRSLGVFAILLQIQEAQWLGLPWLYLGYWIKESRKMNYKCNFRPLEAYRNGRWSLLEESALT